MAQGGDVGAGAEWDSPAAIWHEFPHALPSPRWGRDRSSMILLASYLWVQELGNPIAKMHLKPFDPSAMESPQGMTWERNS